MTLGFDQPLYVLPFDHRGSCRTVGPAVAWDLVQTFLAADFSQAERHVRRLGKVASIEAGGR
jgi:hypothetical protein